MRGQRHAPAASYPRERPGTRCTGGWVGLRTSLDRYGKSRPPPGFDPRTVQSVGSRYTDRATVAHAPILIPTFISITRQHTVLAVASVVNLLKPNDIYICHTAALISRRYILNIYSTNIRTEYFKHAA